jgi:N-acetylneuraminic acid mutarotase
MKTNVTLLLIFLSVTALCIVNLSNVWADNNSWTTKTSMPTARAGVGVAAVNGKIYAIGGWYPCPINTTEEYNPSTDMWSSKQAMPTARMFFGTAVYQDKIYVMGGKIGQKATNQTEVYDPSTDTWTPKASMPIACYDLSANLVNCKIYLIGGIKPLNGNNITCINTTQIYDLQTGTWTIGTPIPNAVYCYASAVVGNKIYVISGSTLSPNTVTNLTQVYDTQTDTWSTQAPIPTPVNAPAGISINNGDSPKIYVIGGGGTQFASTYNLIQIYDVHGNFWSTGASLPSCSFTLGVAELDGTLYAVGGADDLSAKNSVYALGLGSGMPDFSVVAILVSSVIFVVAFGVFLRYQINKKST